jgi:hypothetical protein
VLEPHMVLKEEVDGYEKSYGGAETGPKDQESADPSKGAAASRQPRQPAAHTSVLGLGLKARKKTR